LPLFFGAIGKREGQTERKTQNQEPSQGGFPSIVAQIMLNVKDQSRN
jgi:hypothetical protein